eukprot:5569799-Amphidinium_carterae.2
MRTLPVFSSSSTSSKMILPMFFSSSMSSKMMFLLNRMAPGTPLDSEDEMVASVIAKWKIDVLLYKGSCSKAKKVPRDWLCPASRSLQCFRLIQASSLGQERCCRQLWSSGWVGATETCAHSSAE